MKILVTGGAGFIGSNLCERLLKENNVICVDNFNDYYDPKVKEDNVKGFLENKNFELHKIDILDKEKLYRLFQRHKIDKIVHLAARAGVRPSLQNPELYHEVNVNGTLNLLELAKEFNVKSFIFGSSSSVYGTNKKVPFSETDSLNNMISPYAVTKRKAEKLCEKYSELGLNITCLRFFTVYGPKGRPDMAVYKFTSKISKNEEIEVYGSGNSERDYTYIDDIVNGILLSLDKNFKFEIINLGNSNPVKLNYLIKLIEKNLGKKANIIRKEEQEGDVPRTYADISKAKKLLGWQPKIKIEEGIKRFVEWYKNNHEKTKNFNA